MIKLGERTFRITMDTLRVLSQLTCGLSLKNAIKSAGGVYKEGLVTFFDQFEKSDLLIPMGEVTRDYFFIQIGSNNGKQGDPIHNFIINNAWRGILIEPVTYLFKKLKQNYAHASKLIFENMAIADQDGFRTLYRVKENDQKNNPVWYDQLGSFRADVVKKHEKFIPQFKKHFIEEKVQCLTLKSLLKKHSVKKIDLLHIDTEGYDYEIIKTIDFKSITPKILIYEEKHLNEKDKIKCRSLLTQKGYKLIAYDGDVFAHIIR